MSENTWTNQEEQAAQLVAAGDLSNQEIADKVGIGRSTLYRWTLDPIFASHVDEITAEYRKMVLRRGIAKKERRVDALNDRWNRLRNVVDTRAEDPSLATVPGGPTGLIVRETKGIGKGEDFQVIHTFKVDTGLLKEIREHEKQAAQELDQWNAKDKPTGPTNVNLTYTNAEPDDPTPEAAQEPTQDRP